MLPVWRGSKLLNGYFRVLEICKEKLKGTLVLVRARTPPKNCILNNIYIYSQVKYRIAILYLGSYCSYEPFFGIQ